MLLTKLDGHSGCNVLLCEDEDGLTFVRKTAGEIAYNHRLEIQCEKQQHFHGKRIKAPVVYQKGYDNNGLFFFDMEYIQGITAAEFLKTVEIGQIRNIVDIIVNEFYMQSENGESASDDAKEAFLEKLLDLQRKDILMQNRIVSKAVDMLMDHDWSHMIHTYCHGDLTLENIIIKDGQLWVIDFLDSFYDSWIMDAATILQDAQEMWAYRDNISNINTTIRLIIFRDIFVDRIKEKAPENYFDILYVLLLKMVRIVPYTDNDQTKLFLEEKMNHLMDSIRQKGRA